MNILSLDIDYAYSPTISAYDDYVVGSTITLEAQEKILKDKNMPEPTVNTAKLKELRQTLTGKILPSSHLVIAKHHHDILSHLPRNKEFSIFNIDHHHDIFYPGWHSLDVLDEGNWAHRLADYNCQKYTWIRNKDSENLDATVKIAFQYEEAYLEDVSLPNFDFVFCCSSPHWTGKAGQQVLLDLLKEIL